MVPEFHSKVALFRQSLFFLPDTRVNDLARDLRMQYKREWTIKSEDMILNIDNLDDWYKLRDARINRLRTQKTKNWWRRIRWHNNHISTCPSKEGCSNKATNWVLIECAGRRYQKNAYILVTQTAFITCQEICIKSNVAVSRNRDQNSGARGISPKLSKGVTVIQSDLWRLSFFLSVVRLGCCERWLHWLS